MPFLLVSITGKPMNEKTLEALQQLATKFGTTAEKLWDVLLYQAFLSALTSTFVLVTFITATSVYISWMTGELRRNKERDKVLPDEGVFCMWIGALILVAATLTVAGVTLGNIVSGFVNPEFWAFQELVDSIPRR